MKRTLRHDQTLFREIDVFDRTYLPLHLYHRDAQVEELAFLISPALQGGTSMNGILRGPPGTGKTTTIRSVFAELAEETERILPVYVNCRQDHTVPAVYRRIFEEIFGYAPLGGWYLEDIRDKIAARLRDRNARLLVCFDDANYLVAEKTYNLLLYQLLRLYERWDGVRGAGIFAVTSDLRLNLYAEADGAVRSVFHPHEINFWPYTKAEIREILADRVRQGLYPRVMPKFVLDRIAGIAADEQDIRVGIDLIREATMRTEKDGRRRVTLDDVEGAALAAIAPAIQARAEGLSAGERALLHRIAEQARDGIDMTSGTIFEATCEYLPIAKSTYHEYLNQIARVGIVDLVAGPGRGRERKIQFRYDPEDVASVCRRLD